MFKVHLRRCSQLAERGLPSLRRRNEAFFNAFYCTWDLFHPQCNWQRSTYLNPIIKLNTAPSGDKPQCLQQNSKYTDDNNVAISASIIIQIKSHSGATVMNWHLRILKWGNLDCIISRFQGSIHTHTNTQMLRSPSIPTHFPLQWLKQYFTKLITILSKRYLEQTFLACSQPSKNSEISS